MLDWLSFPLFISAVVIELFILFALSKSKKKPEQKIKDLNIKNDTLAKTEIEDYSSLSKLEDKKISMAQLENSSDIPLSTETKSIK